MLQACFVTHAMVCQNQHSVALRRLNQVERPALACDRPSTAQTSHPLTIKDIGKEALLLHALLYMTRQFLFVDDRQRVIAEWLLTNYKRALSTTV